VTARPWGRNPAGGADFYGADPRGDFRAPVCGGGRFRCDGYSFGCNYSEIATDVRFLVIARSECDEAIHGRIAGICRMALGCCRAALAMTFFVAKRLLAMTKYGFARLL
jgi:hypothetical protein